MMIVDINGNKRQCVSVAPDEQWPGYMKVIFASEARNGEQYHEWYPKKEFVKNNPGLASLVEGAKDLWKEDLGVVSLASTQTMTDKTKKWQGNEFAGYPVWISRGLGEGQTRTITMNTNDTVIIDIPWVVVPDKSSQYVISHNVHDPQIMGNTLPAIPSVKKKKKKPAKNTI